MKNVNKSFLYHLRYSLRYYIFVVDSFDALTQASDFRIARRQVVFLCWMQDSKLGSLRHQIASRLNAHSQTDWAIEDQTKKSLNSIARPYDEWVFNPLDFTGNWLSHLALAIYMFVVFNFVALAQASDFFESKGDTLISSDKCRIRSWLCTLMCYICYWSTPEDELK